MFTKLKHAAKRGTLLLSAFGLIAWTCVNALPAFMPAASADALNPLTDRSLSLSSSSPGWSYTDGSGNSTYAQPNSGANGKQTGNTFQFNVSTDSSGGTPSINGLSFQYCTGAAGLCLSPGNDGFTQTGTALTTCEGADNCTRGSDSVSGQTADLNIASTTPSEVPLSGTGNYTNYINTTTGAVTAVPAPASTGDNFVVLDNPYVPGTGYSGWTYSGGWTMAVSNNEDAANVGQGPIYTNNGQPVGATGKDNFIQLLSTTGLQMSPQSSIKVIFFGTDANYITNPGMGAFFVKINDYADTNTGTGEPKTSELVPTDHQYGTAACTTTDACIVDGGVTVANVMNQSIEIQTKVLETMEFSVGTVDPDTVAGSHTACDTIGTGTGGNNTISMGNSTQENSLAVGQPYDAYSYWRLSSNSSNGATVYYSGNTLSNTENNHIGQIYNTSGTGNNPATGLPWAPGDGSADFSRPGSEQFGLGIAANDVGSNVYEDDYSIAASDLTNGYSQDGANVDSAFTTDVNTNDGGSNQIGDTWHLPQLYPLLPDGNYGLADGSIATAGANAQFAFSSTANTIPAAIADESNQVVNCSTGEMRYIANIAATTAAGIYTTKINYIAAPEY